MPKVLVVSQHARHYRALIEAAQLPDLDGHFCDSADAARPLCGDAEILFGAPDLLAPLLPDCKRLRWLQSSWAGVKPLVDAGRRDYALTGVKQIFGPAMSEYVLGWLLAIERNILTRARAQRWDSSADGSLAGRQLGIMGTGSIGRQVAATAAAFGLEVRGLNTDGHAAEGFSRCHALADIANFADSLDYLVALLPDTPASDHLVDATLLRRLAPGAIFINAGRANCVRMRDLLSELRGGRLRAAVLDVLETEPLAENDPLWREPGVYLTSHSAAPTPPQAIVAIFCENYRHYIAAEPLQYPVDFERGY